MDAVKRMIKLARKFWGMIIISFIIVLFATALGLVTPWMISKLTAELNSAVGIDMRLITAYSLVLGGSFLLRAILKFLSFYIAHYCAWNFVPWLTNTVYDRM